MQFTPRSFGDERQLDRVQQDAELPIAGTLTKRRTPISKVVVGETEKFVKDLGRIYGVFMVESRTPRAAGSHAKILWTNIEFGQECGQITNDERSILVEIGWRLSVLILLGFQDFLGFFDDDCRLVGRDIIDGALFAGLLLRVEALS